MKCRWLGFGIAFLWLCPSKALALETEIVGYVPTTLSMITEKGKSKRVLSLYGTGIEYRYFSNEKFVLASQYEWSTSGKGGILYHGPAFLAQYSLLGQKSLQVNEESYKMSLKYKWDFFVFGGLIYHWYDFRDLDPQRAVTVTKDPRNLITGTMYGMMGGAGIAYEIVTGLRILLRAQIGKVIYADAVSTTALLPTAHVGLGVGL